MSRLPKIIFVLSLLPLFTDGQITVKGRRATYPSVTDPYVFSFSLPTASKTSAAVYKGDSLVRTLWSAKSMTSGLHVDKWDGLTDDSTVAPAPLSQYTIKYLSGNVSYQWEGAIGNTSGAATTGSTKHRTFSPTKALAIVGNTMYCGAGYNEGFPASYKVNLSNPQARTFIGPPSATNLNMDYVVSDGINVYWAGYDPLEVSETLVIATKVSDDSQTSFSAGVPAQMMWGSLYPSTLAYRNGANTYISGLALSSNYLFVARVAQNELLVLNKTSGAVAQTLSVNAPGNMVVDSSGFLWMSHSDTLEKYTINSGGTLTTTGVKVTGLQHIAAVSVNAAGLMVIAEGGTSQILRAYNSSGVSQWTYGQTGGYMVSPNVTNDRFYFTEVNRIYESSIVFQSDGSFWIVDQGNNRTIHLSSSRSYINQIMYQANSYRVQVDPNNKNRIFSDYFEFYVDYTKPIDSSWTLVKNWGATIYQNQYDAFQKFTSIATLSNGRTYGILRRVSNAGYEVVEFPSSGNIRLTGVVDAAPFNMYGDGSKVRYLNSGLGATSVINSYPMTGFDGSGNPIWSSTPVQTFTPSLTTKDPFVGEGIRGDIVTSGNKVILYDYNKPTGSAGAGFKLAALDKGSNKWSWHNMRGTGVDYNGPFPVDGAFDNGNQVIYPGGSTLISGRNLFVGYHGENWKQSQTNKWNHFDENGMMVDQFGVVTPDAFGENAPAGAAGNVLNGNTVVIADTVYLWHNDESAHAGIHRWKITGLNNVTTNTATFPSSQTFTPPGGIDLLAGLSRGVMQNNVAGWTRYPTVDSTNYPNYFLAAVGRQSYDPFKNLDVSVYSAMQSLSTNVTRTLGSNTGLISWKIQGIINLLGNEDAEPHGYGGSYIEVLDNADKVIARLFVERQDAGTSIKANGQVMYFTTGNEIALARSRNKPLEISLSGGLITIKYAEFSPVTTAVKVDASANFQNPSKFRFSSYTLNPQDNKSRAFDVSQLRFYPQ